MIIRSPQVAVTFPGAVDENSDEAALAETSWRVYATHINPHIPFVPGYDRYWVEWSSSPTFTGSLHVAGLVTPTMDFMNAGDFYDGSIIGFAPNSTWYFRVVASNAGEYPDVSPEQWNSP